MKKIDDEIDVLKGIVKCIAKQFGEDCEVVLHDLSKDLEHTIVAIENSHVTGREVGGCVSNTGFELFKQTQNGGSDMDNDGLYNYRTTTKNGKMLRSSSAFINNDEGKPIGSICINFDITELVAAKNTIQSITHPVSSTNKNVNEIYVKNVKELLDLSLQECQDYIGKSVPLMTKMEKNEAIRFLDKKGIFLITKSGDRVCELFNISKFTLYNILNDIRKNRSPT